MLIVSNPLNVVWMRKRDSNDVSLINRLQVLPSQASPVFDDKTSQLGNCARPDIKPILMKESLIPWRGKCWLGKFRAHKFDWLVQGSDQPLCLCHLSLRLHVSSLLRPGLPASHHQSRQSLPFDCCLSLDGYLHGRGALSFLLVLLIPLHSLFHWTISPSEPVNYDRPI